MILKISYLGIVQFKSSKHLFVITRTFKNTKGSQITEILFSMELNLEQIGKTCLCYFLSKCNGPQVQFKRH